jgi:hypothetical protein
MLWEYVYIGSDVLRTALIGLGLTWPTCGSTATTPNPQTARPPKNGTNRQKKSNPSKKNTQLKRSTVVEETRNLGTLLALEPRIMFDGAAFVTGAEVIQDQSTQDQIIQDQDLQGIDAETDTFSNPLTDNIDLYSSWSTVAAPSERREIVFIDTKVEDYQTLLLGIDPSAEAVLLDSTRDGIEQIAEILRQRTDIDAIHLIAEGNAAELHLGTTFLTQQSIKGQYAALFTQIGQSLSADADLLIYGCNFVQGEAGLRAMKTLAELTGADIAASTDRTGHVSEYANWELEVATGFIETSVIIGEATQEAWEGVLATFTVTNTNDSGAGSLRQAIIDANNTSGTDTIIIPTGTYVLTSGKLDINDDVIITGADAATTIIDGNANDRVFETNGSITVTMSGLAIQNGRASGNGAGVFVDNSSILNLSDAILTNNDGTGGDGGAFHVHGTLNLNRVLIDNNQANKGAGIYFHNAIGGTLTNVTISGNTATNEGGGIWTENPITIMNSTITFNTAPIGGGVYDKDGLEITITNTILHNLGSPNSFGTLSSGGNNIDSDDTAGLGDPLDGQDPMLGALADNGGPTRTHALLAGSPALNAGATSGAPAVDQRGLTRDAAPDIGAYEYKPSAFVSKNEFTVNDPSGNNEITSGPLRGAERAVGIAPNGDYVVVWTNGSTNNQVYAKVFDAAGNEKVAQFQVNINAGQNKWTDVSMDDSGNFVVTWTQTDDIYMRRFLANGTAVDAGDVQVNTITSNIQLNPSVKMNGAGDFVIAWEGNINEGIFVRRGSFGGGLIGSDITVDPGVTAQDPSVGIDDSGNFVVVWDNGSDVFFQLYNSAGVPQNSGQVDIVLQASAGGAAVDMSGDGRFTVAYRATVLNVDVYVRQYDASGNPLFLPQLANTSILGTQTSPSVTMDDIGEFIVVWEGAGSQLGQIDGAGVFGQKFNASGQKIGFEFLINQTTANTQDRASVDMLDRDNFVAVWTGSDGAQTDVFARQYGATTSSTLDLDANDSSGATGNDYAFTFTEGDGPTAIADIDTDLADVDSTTFAYVTLSVSGLLDGNAEVLVLDGDTFALATDAPGQDTSGGNYHVRVSTAAGTAIVSIIKQGGGTFSEAEAETLIKAIQYQHTDTTASTEGDRLIEVRVNDGTTDSAAARTTINVNPVNDPPSAVADGFTVNEGLTTTLNLANNDTDPDDGLDLTSIAIVSGPTNGSITGINADGTVEYTHDGSETLSDSFTYTIDDLTGVTSNTVTVNLTITPQNDAPTAVPDSFNVNEGSTNTLDLAGNDTDPDDALDLTSITIVSGPTNGTITSVNANGTVDYTHDGSETLSDSFTYTIRDLAGATSNAVTVSLTVTPVNDPPIITSNGGGTTATVSVLTGTTAVTDVDATDAEGSPLTYSIIGGADAALFTIDPTTGVLNFITTPNVQTPGDAGADNVYDVIVQASDGLAVDTQAIAVTVTDVPPVVFPPPPPDPSPEPSPPPDNGDTDEDLPPIGIDITQHSPGFSSGVSQDSRLEGPQHDDSLKKPSGNDLTLIQMHKGGKGLGSTENELVDTLGQALGFSNLKSQIQALFGASSGFLQDLDDARDGLNHLMGTEKTFLASSVAASTGLSIGYVIWLLRSGVLLTALLSSVPAWQFVNPLLVLGSPAKKGRKTGPEDKEDDSIESMFEQRSHTTETSVNPTTVTRRPFLSRWFRHTKP